MVKHFDHVTFVVEDVARAKAFFALLVLAGAVPRTEIQLLKYHHPGTTSAGAGNPPTRLGFNHICFAVDDIAAELDKLRAHGVALLNDVMDFHDRKLVFVAGPEDIVVELSQWHGGG